MLSSDGTIVNTFEEFRNALEQGDETYVIFGSDITMDRSGGIKIPPEKTEVLIDGNGHQYKDYGSDTTGIGLLTNTIRYKSMQDDTDYFITFKNAKITGVNYFGVFYAAGASSVHVYQTYENITYKGSQIGYNKWGSITFRDCHIEVSTDYVSEAEEITECNRVVLAGNTDIIHKPISSAFDMFPLENNAPVPDSKYLAIEENAAVTFTTSQYFFKNIKQLIIKKNGALTGNVRKSLFSTNTSPIPFIMEEGSSFNLTAPAGFSSSGTDSFGPITIGKNARLSNTQTVKNGTVPSLICNGDFTVSEGAEVYLEASYSGTAAALLKMQTSGSTLKLNNPRSFILKHTSPKLFDFTKTELDISAKQINEWAAQPDPADPGGLTNLPDHAWYRIREKAGSSYGPYVSVTGTATNSDFTLKQTNLTPEEQQELPDYSLLLPVTNYVFAVGELPLFVNPIAVDHYPIFGTTEPGAKLEASYTLEDKTYTLDATAETNGTFSIPTETSLPLDVSVSVFANKNFLYAKEFRTVVPVGSIDMNIPSDTLVFSPVVITDTPVKLCGRKITDWSIIVDDTRARSTPWRLEAISSGNMAGDKGHLLPDALVFVDNDQLNIINETPTVVFSGSANAGEPKTTTIQWPSASGMLLQVTGTPFYNGEKYSCTIAWSLKTEEE